MGWRKGMAFDKTLLGLTHFLPLFRANRVPMNVREEISEVPGRKRLYGTDLGGESL
jgi:hypothetical protein